MIRGFSADRLIRHWTRPFAESGLIKNTYAAELTISAAPRWKRRWGLWYNAHPAGIHGDVGSQALGGAVEQWPC